MGNYCKIIKPLVYYIEPSLFPLSVEAINSPISSQWYKVNEVDRKWQHVSINKIKFHCIFIVYFVGSKCSFSMKKTTLRYASKMLTFFLKKISCAKNNIRRKSTPYFLFTILKSKFVTVKPNHSTISINNDSNSDRNSN